MSTGTYYTGLWRAGADAHAALVGKEWPEFSAAWAKFDQQGLRMIDFETYEEGGKRLYAGLWRSGTDAHAALVGKEWPEFSAAWAKFDQQGLRMIDFETYEEGGKRLYAGLWRAGTDAHSAWVGVDWENFSAQWHGFDKQNLRAIDIEIYPAACDAGCLNQVVMPKSYSVDVEEGDRYARLSALYYHDQLLTLPFSDPLVKRRGIWRYGNMGWHHGGDYSRDDVKTFPVLASAPGRVIFIGWDTWSGNTIVVSHDVGSVKDAYRTIYMHLRDGPKHDTEMAWSKTVPTLSGDTLTSYEDLLTNTGCPQTGKQNPDPAYWGTDAHKVDMSLLNTQVAAGKQLGWSGNTGPGGQQSVGAGPNAHIHMFWTRRDQTNNT